jgi:hypothetical protein
LDDSKGCFEVAGGDMGSGRSSSSSGRPATTLTARAVELKPNQAEKKFEKLKQQLMSKKEKECGIAPWRAPWRKVTPPHRPPSPPRPHRARPSVAPPQPAPMPAVAAQPHLAEAGPSAASVALPSLLRAVAVMMEQLQAKPVGL